MSSRESAAYVSNIHHRRVKSIAKAQFTVFIAKKNASIFPAGETISEKKEEEA